MPLPRMAARQSQPHPSSDSLNWPSRTCCGASNITGFSKTVFPPIMLQVRHSIALENRSLEIWLQTLHLDFPRQNPLPPQYSSYSLIFLKQIGPNRCLSACTLINENIVRMEIRSQMFNTLFKKSSASLKSSTNPNMTDVQGSFAWGRLKFSL